MRCKLLALASAALALCAPVSAKNPARGWFLGADVGTSNLDGNVEYFGEAPVDFDETSTLVDAQLGYVLNSFATRFAAGYRYGKAGELASHSLFFGAQFEK